MTIIEFGGRKVLELEEVDRLLDPNPLPLETGLERLSSGVLHVACRTDMDGCKGKMLTWWFGWFQTTQHYVWWHPGDHVSSAWENWAPGRFIGAVHDVEEKLGGDEVLRLNIQFRDPREFFTPAKLDAALTAGTVSGIVNGRVGLAPNLVRDEQGRVLGGRLIHVCRDTPYGMTLRSHVYLGVDLPGSAADRAAAVPDEVGLALVKHLYTEYKFLSHLLPPLYRAENRDKEPLALPW